MKKKLSEIAKRRRARKLTQARVAGEIGISLARYWRLEHGVNIKDETAVRARLDQFFDDAVPGV